MADLIKTAVYHDHANRRSSGATATAERYTQADLDRGLLHYRTLRENLEANHPDEFVTIDIDTGEFVVGPSALGSSAAFRQQHGSGRHTFTYHIGTTY